MLERGLGGLLVQGILGNDGSIKGIVGTADVSHESTSVQVSDVLRGGHLLVGMVVGQALLGGSDVYLVVLKLHGGLHDAGQDPGTGAQSNPFEEEGDDEEDVCDGVVQEGNGES